MKPKHLIVILSLILAICVIALPTGPGWLTSVTLPIRNSVSESVAWSWNFADWFGDVGKLAEERDAVVAERNELLARVVELEAVERQNQSLLRQIEVVDDLKDKELIMATMAGVVTQGGVSHLLIDKGSDDGIVEGQVVMADGVLVGRVRRVMSTTATVQLPQSLGSVIPVQIRYGDEVSKGVVEGSYNLTATLDQVLLSERLEEGSTLLTSGDGGTFPPNLVVGKVGAVQRADNQLFQSAEVVLPWEVSRLEVLFVIKEKRQ